MTASTLASVECLPAGSAASDRTWQAASPSSSTVSTCSCRGLHRAIGLTWARTAALVGILWTGLLGCAGRKTDGDEGHPPPTTSPVEQPFEMGEVQVADPEVLLGKICPLPGQRR